MCLILNHDFRKEGRREGQKGGRKDRREEGREGGRTEGREEFYNPSYIMAAGSGRTMGILDIV